MLKDIFKGYDIRGIYPDELDEDVAYRIGRAFVILNNVKEVAVGHDMRESSPKLHDALVKGITDQGADVVELGLCSTPMFTFAAKFYDFQSAISVTASHNPGRYNGFKMYANNRFLNYEQGISQIAEKIEDLPELTGEKGNVSKKEIMNDYIKHVLSFIDEIPDMKIVIDTGNGMAGYTIPKIFEDSSLEIVPLYFKLDGNFPNHEANPIKPENIQDLVNAVKKEKVDFGVAFDGDADRIMFCDEKGEIISSDIIGLMIALDYLEKKNEKVLFDLRSTKAAREEVEKKGGTFVMSRVGHAYIKETMKKQDIIFGAELSGHYYYKENFFMDSGIITLLKVLAYLKKHDKPISELVKPLKRYYHSGEINFEVHDKDAKIQQIKNHYAVAQMHELDGLTVEFDGWWFNVRKSNTEPVLRLILEAESRQMMDSKLDEVVSLINSNV